MALPTPTLTVTCITGLGNRLFVLLSGIALAEASGREFTMVWKRDEPCGALFGELFCNDWNVRSDLRVEHALNLEGIVPNQLPDLLVSSARSLAVRHWGWLIDPSRFPAHAELEQRSQELMWELQPLPSILQQVETFRRDFFRPQMIGVQLRFGDRAAANSRARPNIAATIKYVDKFLDRAPQAGILLCTDDGAPEPYTGKATPISNSVARFGKRYGTRLVMTHPSSLDRRSPAAIRGALVDLWLLRGTDFFIGTPGSSFSELAVYGRAVPSAFPSPGLGSAGGALRLLRRLGIVAKFHYVGRDANGNLDPNAPLAARQLRRLLSRLGTRL